MPQMYPRDQHHRLVTEHADRERLRQTFGTVAEQYDRARPTYPSAVYDDLAALGGIPPGGRVLEIGPGTGKATVELARRGYEVVAVELSPDLAAVARRNLEAFPHAEIATADFEAAPTEFLEGGDHVVVLGRYTGRAKASGAPLDIPFAHVWRFRNGRAVEFHQFTDTKGWTDALAFAA